MKNVVLVLFCFFSQLAFSLSLEYSQNYFDPERAGETQWKKINSQAEPALTVDLGRIKVGNLQTRYFSLRIINDSSSSKQISFANLPSGFKWKDNPPATLAAQQKLILDIELESTGVGKKFADIQVSTSGVPKKDSIHLTFEVKE